MHTELELHDSEVEAICFSGSDLVIDVPRAVVYPAAEETSLSPGTYLQPVVLTFVVARAKGSLPQKVGFRTVLSPHLVRNFSSCQFRLR